MKKNLFSRFFKKEEALLENYSFLHTDIHSHLIPGIDDGAKTMDDSLTLIWELYSLGFKKVITTPHIMGDFYKNTPEIINAGLTQVREAIAEAKIPIEIEAAAEYYLDEFFEEKLNKEPLLTFGEKYLLVEFSFVNPPFNLYEIIFKIQSSGYKPVLAHPERYPFWYRNIEEVKRLKEKGVYFMLNTNSLAGYYGQDAQIMANKLVELNMVDFLGSDTHHMKHIKSLGRALNEKGLRKLSEAPLLNSQV